VRSAGGWPALRSMHKGESRMKGDERILGQGDTDSESIRGKSAENHRREKVGIFEMTEPIIQWTLRSTKIYSKSKQNFCLT